MQLLETWNMVNQFQLYLKFEKKKSVDKTRNWITTKIAEANSKVLECNDGNRNNLITATISRDTAHRWMLLHGCSYEKYTRTYYTDSHNSPSTVSYRNTEYIPKLDVISVREPLWVSVREQDASQAALDHLHRMLSVLKLTKHI